MSTAVILAAIVGLAVVVPLTVAGIRRARRWWADRPAPEPTRHGLSREQLLRQRTGVRAALALAVAATISANVLHAQPTLIGRIISGWAPMALLIAIEIITRVPLRRSPRVVVVWIVTAGIAGIAAWVSYWHMVAVCERYGEDTVAAHLIPLSVDGLVVITSIYLVEINRMLREIDAAVAVLVAKDEPVIVRPRPQDEQDGDQDEDGTREDGTDGEDGRPGLIPVSLAARRGPIPAQSSPNGHAKIGEDGDQDGEDRPQDEDDGRPPTQAQIDEARRIARRWQQENSKRITRDQLRQEMGVGTNTASALLPHLNGTTG